MSKPNPHQAPTKGEKSKGECCKDSKCESGLRNEYYSGKRLTADSFRVEQRYHRERRHLLNRAIHGWGVVYGYGVGAASTSDCQEKGAGRLCVGAGLALDRCGRELLQVGKLTLDLRDVIVLDERGARIELERTKLPVPETCWLLSVHYAEQHGGPVTVSDPCSCERHEHDHVCETVRYSLQAIAREKACTHWPCELHCNCDKGDCCKPEVSDAREGQARALEAPGGAALAIDMIPIEELPLPPNHDPRPVSRPAPEPIERGGCRCLCDHLIGLEVGGECGLCELEESCGRVWVDLRNGVPLACVDVVADPARRWIFGEAEPCGPRRLVKRNDLLFDLIRGCDLTRISHVSWADWHRREKPIPFEVFSRAFGEAGDHKSDYLTDFAVSFSRPVREETLLPDCFAMTVISVESTGGWWRPRRVPIVRLEMIRRSGDPSGQVRGAKLVVGGAWLEDDVRGRHSLFLAGPTRVEIEVRGDFILDCNGQAVDANARGLDAAPSGNGVPGNTFLSTFLVDVAKETPANPASQETESAS